MSGNITSSQYRTQNGKKRKNKYGAQKCVVGDLKFDSKHEARRWTELKLLERAGKISLLERQVPIKLQGAIGPILTRKGRAMKYVADFCYLDVETNKTVFEDAKGYATREYIVKAGIVKAMGLDLREV